MFAKTPFVSALLASFALVLGPATVAPAATPEQTLYWWAASARAVLSAGDQYQVKGRIAELNIYRRVLKPEEIARNASGSRP